ncbi:MAG: class I SAM-dependent methyltransferase [Alphaproteobacteria bacterium]|nr:class I SAM-dependent methyltransferase [Alphaproteobacteria bacterium]
MSDQAYWEKVYQVKAPDQVSWYAPHLGRSLDFISEARLPPGAAIIDIGGGAATLVDDLLVRGYTNVTVLDLASAAIAHAQERLRDRADQVNWLSGDVTEVVLPKHSIDFWHDRAVFHFLGDETERRRYVATVRHAVKPGGHVLVATFGPDGPERCSGLEVIRFTEEGIHAEFGGEFHKIGGDTEIHTTPWGSVQQFVYCYCRLG